MLNLGMLQPECIYELPKENSTSLFQGFVDDVNQHPGFLEENSPTELVDPTARPGSTLDGERRPVELTLKRLQDILNKR